MTHTESTESPPVARTFDKVMLVVAPGAPPLNYGTLRAWPDRLELEGKQAKTTITAVRGVAFEDGFARVTHGAGDAVSTTYLAKSVVGRPKTQKEVRRQFVEDLQSVCGETALSGSERDQVELFDAAVRDAKLRGARRSVRIGAALLLAGLLLTGITYAAASGGGTYVLAWGPVLAGLVMVITGLVNQAKYRGPGSRPA
jgi:hypothetical protein